MEAITMTLIFPLGTYISKRGLNGRLQMTLGCTLGVTSLFLSSYITNFWGFFFLYAFGFGACNGIAVRISLLV
jgi:hypothetical protein